MLHIEQTVYEKMLAHVQQVYPNEGCGLLAGHTNRATQHYPVDNILNSPVRYEMDPLQQVRAMLAIEDAGLEMVAIYHSHPNGPPTPSPTDVANAYYPEAAHIIISLQDQQMPQVNSFYIVDGAIYEMSWVTVQR